VARWIEDKHCFQVYQYEEELLVTSVSAGDKRLPDASEREILMGFDVGYTSVAVAEKASARNTVVTGAQLVGNSFHVPTISYLLGELLLAQNLVKQPLPLELGLAVSFAAEPWSSKELFSEGQGTLEQQRNLVGEFFRRAEKGGSDVRLDVGIPFRPKAWPRAGLRADLWGWKIIHGYPWRALSHINHLELLAVLNCFK
jgi:hypothetical protein